MVKGQGYVDSGGGSSSNTTSYVDDNGLSQDENDLSPLDYLPVEQILTHSAVKDKANHAVILDKATSEKLAKDVQSYRLVTVAVLVDRLKINGSLARKALADLEEKGTIKKVVAHSACNIYSMWSLHGVGTRMVTLTFSSSPRCWWNRLNFFLHYPEWLEHVGMQYSRGWPLPALNDFSWTGLYS